MKNFIKFIFCLILLTLMPSHGLAQFAFQKLFGNPITAYSAAGKDVAVDNQGNIYMTGYISNQGAVVIKTDSAGNVLWKKSYGPLLGGSGKCRYLNDGNLMIYCSFDLPSPTIYSRLAFLKIDTAGNVIWLKGTHTAEGDQLFDFLVNSKGDIFISAVEIYQDSLFNYYTRNFFMKLDSAGNFVWCRRIPKQFHSTYTGLLLLNDSTFLAAGILDTTGKEGHSSIMILTAFDTAGNALWSKLYADSLVSGGFVITRCGSTGFMLQGNVYTQFPNFKKRVFVKLDQNFNVEWMKKNTNNSGGVITNGINDPDNNMLFIGDSPGVLYMDTMGNVLWSRGYGYSGFNRRITGVQNYLNKGYVMTGEVGATVVMLLVKTDSIGMTPCFTYTLNPPFNAINVSPPFSFNYTLPLIDTVYSFFDIDSMRQAQSIDSLFCAGWTGDTEIQVNKSDWLEVFPNPVTNQAFIRFNEIFSGKNLMLEIVNVNGQLISKVRKERGETTINLNMQHYSQGIYCIREVSHGLELKSILFIKH